MKKTLFILGFILANAFQVLFAQVQEGYYSGKMEMSDKSGMFNVDALFYYNPIQLGATGAVILQDPFGKKTTLNFIAGRVEYFETYAILRLYTTPNSKISEGVILRLFVEIEPFGKVLGDVASGVMIMYEPSTGQKYTQAVSLTARD